MLLVILVLGGMMMALLVVGVVLMSNSGGGNPGGNTSGGTSGGSTGGTGSGGFVKQSGAKPPPCGWYGCMTIPKKPGVKFPSRNFSDKPWVNIGGLTMDGYEKWPRYDGKQFWDPYALNGREEDGGILNDVGVMPIVNPPKDRYGEPYYMEPSWQTGSTSLADYYRQKCAKHVRTRGKLYYVGPQKGGVEGHSVGAYVWVLNPRHDDPKASKWTRFIPQDEFKDPKYMEEAKYRNEGALALLRDGAELPPWNRRGPLSAEQAIRFFCK